LEYQDQQQPNNKKSLSVKYDLPVTGGLKAPDYEAVDRYQHAAAGDHRHGPSFGNWAVQACWRHQVVGFKNRRRFTGTRDCWDIVLEIDG